MVSATQAKVGRPRLHSPGKRCSVSVCRKVVVTKCLCWNHYQNARNAWLRAVALEGQRPAGSRREPVATARGLRDEPRGEA